MPDFDRPLPRRHPDSWVAAHPLTALTALDTVSLFGGWCLLDYALVRSPTYPAGVHDHDWLLAAAPPALFGIGYLIARRGGAPSPLRASVFAVLLSIPVVAFMILTVGIQLHLAFGGRL